MRNLLFRLSPFAASTCGFFAYRGQADYLSESVGYLAFKCAPILTLIAFVLFQIIGPYRFKTTDQSEHYAEKYTKSILLGLILCALGDALLVYDVYFLQGLVAFALGHCAYIFSFGFSEPLHVSSGAVIAAVVSVAYGYIYHSMGEVGVLTVAVAVYCALIGAMVWRAVARCIHRPNYMRCVAAVGALTFAVSDMTLAVNRFVRPLEGAATVIMITYYAAQLAIAVSVVEFAVVTNVGVNGVIEVKGAAGGCAEDESGVPARKAVLLSRVGGTVEGCGGDIDMTDSPCLQQRLVGQ